jgi:Mrp family chromosome partitioning ATPase
VETREQAESTAYAVHHIRTMLQVGYHGGPVTAITGPVSGSGKTSLTIALGLSYASTGAKTLLIDADFIGSGLTQRMEGFRRERLGEILLRMQLIDDSQLQRAIEHAQLENLRLGEALVDLKILTGDDIEQGLSLQRETCPGLLEALRGAPSENSIAETGVTNLDILPLLNGSASQVAAANPDAVERVLRDVAKLYQHVLIDLGPVPGSVEAAVLANAADRTVLVVSRGDSKPRYDRCVEFMHSLGTPLAGVVFNRAGEYDVQHSAAMSASVSRSVSTSRSSSQQRSHSQPDGPNGQVRGDRFGPLGAGVASQDAEER